MGHFGRGGVKIIGFFLAVFAKKNGKSEICRFFLRRVKKRQMWKTGTFEKKTVNWKTLQNNNFGRKLYIIFRFFIFGNKKRVGFKIRKKRQIGKRVQWFLGKTPRGGVFFELSSKYWCFSKEKKTHPQNFVLLKYLLNIENTSGGVGFFFFELASSENWKKNPPLWGVSRGTAVDFF